MPIFSLPLLRQDMEALVGEVGRSHADVALELEGRKQREVSDCQLRAAWEWAVESERRC